MNQVYEALNITKIGPKSRLRTYIGRLQAHAQQQQQQQPNGKLRCCSRILVFNLLLLRIRKCFSILLL
jgi:hypothetical protein